jgi:predicted DsbA family dithiol-disulfide isomerase
LPLEVLSGFPTRWRRQAILFGGSVVVMVLQVDVISDVICPWCFIGKRRLERAVAALDRQHEVRVPFQLNPTLPKEGISRRDYRTKKFGSWERSQELDARMVAVGQTEGIHFAFGRIERTPNTLDAHRSWTRTCGTAHLSF